MTRRISPASFLPDAFFCSKQKNKTTSLRMWFCGAEGGIISQACGREMRPHGIAVSDFGAKNSPPDCFLHAPHPLRVRIPQKQKTRTPDGVLVFWRRRGDSNPRTVLPAYSLSRGAPYSHLGTSAWLQVWVNYEVVGDFKWRREWDSNPRLLRVTGFQDQLLKPLGHLSICDLIIVT